MYKKSLNNEFSKAKSLYLPAGINNTAATKYINDLITGFRISNASAFTLTAGQFRAPTGSVLDDPGAWAAATAYTVGTLRHPIAPNGFQYKATAVAGTGTSGAVEPTWPTTIGATVIDNPGANQITWTCYHKNGINPALTNMWFAAAWGTLRLTDGLNVNAWGWGDLTNGPSVQLPLGVATVRQGYVTASGASYHALPSLASLGFSLNDNLTLIAALVDLPNNRSWQYGYKTALVSAETPANSKTGAALPASLTIGAVVSAGGLLTEVNSLASGVMLGTVSSQAEAEAVFANLATGKLMPW